tara:strand:- start:105288 stop:106541 length:1254 start_codon:yes stop_codon:yes gene_type:complete
MKKLLTILKYFGAIFLIILTVGLSARAILLMPKIWLNDIAAKQNFDMATHISAYPFIKNHYVVSTKAGQVYLFEEGKATRKLMLDISDKVKSNTGEEGLLSTIFDPQNKDVVYLYYSFDNPHGNRLVRMQLSDDKYEILADTEEVILEYLKPHTGHNGGDMKFGSDGYLYLSIGEGGYATKGKSLELPSVYLGSIIRIDPRNASEDKNYSIPSDNPFVGNTRGIPTEVFVHGLRNPWRWSFVDDKTLIIGDVGDKKHEEINMGSAGADFGWPFMEGPKCTRYKKNCDIKSYQMPKTYFSRAVLRSITGGLVYKGEKVKRFKGKYVFGDYLRGIMSLPFKNMPKAIKEVTDSGFITEFPKLPMPFGPTKGDNIHPVSFFEDANNEILVVTLNGGIFRIEEISFMDTLKSFFYMVTSLR